MFVDFKSQYEKKPLEEKDDNCTVYISFYIVRVCCTVLTFKKLFLILCFILSGEDVYRTFYRYRLNMNVDEFMEILRPGEPVFSSWTDDKTKSCVSDIVHVVLFSCIFNLERRTTI